jgi:hypothetical protein
MDLGPRNRFGSIPHIFSVLKKVVAVFLGVGTFGSQAWFHRLVVVGPHAKGEKGDSHLWKDTKDVFRLVGLFTEKIDSVFSSKGLAR